MKKFFYSFTVIYFVFRSLAGLALEVKFLGKSSKPIAKVDAQPIADQSAGDLTIKILTDLQNQGKLKFSGSDQVLESINDLDSHQEFVDPTHLRVFGWCYKVDDELPNVMPNEFVLLPKHKKMLWFYAYATFDTQVGQWTEGCKAVARED